MRKILVVDLMVVVLAMTEGARSDATIRNRHERCRSEIFGSCDHLLPRNIVYDSPRREGAYDLVVMKTVDLCLIPFTIHNVTGVVLKTFDFLGKNNNNNPRIQKKPNLLAHS